MKIFEYPDKPELKRILQRPLFNTDNLYTTVKSIINTVKQDGDTAILELTRKFDKIRLNGLKAEASVIDESENSISPELKKAIEVASENIMKFHKSQIAEPEKVETMPGIQCWQKSVAIEKVGLYIPGGTAPLLSTVLMLAIPAKLAGCKEIILCTPPDKNGNINPAILYAAKTSGVTSVFRCGGAQAIAGIAYGTESIPKVDKIFGPGNQYVTCAKQIVSSKGIAIDMPAGPSEVLILADETANPDFIAADLLSQAEHGEDSQVIMVSNCKNILQKTLSCIKKQLDVLPRKSIAQESLKSGALILIKDYNEMIDISNEYAPEHLIISTNNYMELTGKITNAGSVFLGNYTPESLGDYASGTNHTLPTNGYARSYSGLNMDAFYKKITFQESTPQGLKNIGPYVELMAETEQLDAHKNAVSIRLKDIKYGNQN